MKLHRFPFAVSAVVVLFLTGRPLLAQPEAESIKPEQSLVSAQLSSEIKPLPVLAAMQRVADWQLAHPSITSNRPANGWVQAVGDAGMMALAGISGDAKYRDAMLALGETNGWQLGKNKKSADDQCVGQTYAELYLLYRDPDQTWQNAPSDRHNRGLNLSFADGHCEHWKWRAPKNIQNLAEAAAGPDDLQDLRRLQAALPGAP